MRNYNKIWTDLVESDPGEMVKWDAKLKEVGLSRTGSQTRNERKREEGRKLTYFWFGDEYWKLPGIMEKQI